MKKLVFLFAMIFAVSMAMAQNTAVVTQSGGASDKISTNQNGDGNDINIEQILPDDVGYNEAGAPDGDPIKQDGDNNIARLKQTVENTTGDEYNLAKIKQEGDNNKLVGATDGALLDDDESWAIQTTTLGKQNSLNILQNGGNGNKIGLYQYSQTTNQFGTSDANIEQRGEDNELVVHQSVTHNNAGIVFTESEQIGDKNLARVKQTGNKRFLTIVQNGDYNELIGANSDGSIDITSTSHAGQLTTGHQQGVLDVTQLGNSNVIGLYQDAHKGPNTATITQSGGTNSLGAYQERTSGNSGNFLTVTQSGGDAAKVSQIGSGVNTATISQ